MTFLWTPGGKELIYRLNFHLYKLNFSLRVTGWASDNMNIASNSNISKKVRLKDTLPSLISKSIQ